MNRGFAGALLLGLAAALACVWIDTPPPWLVGPLFSGANPVSPRATRRITIGDEAM
jgi:hypothetical protein